MSYILGRYFTVALLALLCTAWSRADVLFQSHDALDISMQASFETIRAQRDKSKSYQGMLKTGGASYDVEIGVRGNNRLNRLNCTHPPLSIRFDEKKVKGTLFEHQKNLKLVVQCKKYGLYKDLLRKEYLAYRLFNLVSELSYQVRWLELSYLDEEGSTKLEPGFFIERKSRVAKRTGLKKTEIPSIKHDELEAGSTALVTLFQYVIGNADYSLIGSGSGECCHNAKILQASDGKYVPIIYDFDSSGIVDAKYASPNASLRQKKITDRIFRGYCGHLPELQAARNKLLSLESAMLALVEEDAVLSSKAVAKTAKYLRKSFTILREDKLYDKYIVGKCRGET